VPALASPARPFKPNPWCTGFVLKPGSFEVDGVDGCFVIGPLLNRPNPDIRVESIHAVYRAAEQLAHTIHARLLQIGNAA
jgi:uncharacterized protein YbjT (DUF2867 family)